MESSYTPYFDPDYGSLIQRMHPPRVCIDNETCKDCTLVKVDSVNKHGVLLEMVQVVTDLDLVIPKSYISTDGEWFMDVDSVNKHGVLLEMVQVVTDLDLVIPKSYISTDGEWFMDVDSVNKHGVLLEMVQVVTDLDLVIPKSYISTDGEWFMDVDSVNKHGVLLEMVQVVTDLDLVIPKSYISTDGEWFMDAMFHVWDQLGNKLIDESLIRYIKQALGAGGKRWILKEVQTCLGRVVRPNPVNTAHAALKMTMMDRPGLLSEISAVLADLGCQVHGASAWTHNSHAVCIIYMEDKLEGGGTITDPDKLAQVEEQLENVVGAHYGNRETMRVRFASPTMSKTHTERRLHQLLYDDRDYERCNGGNGSEEKHDRSKSKGTKVSIEIFKEKGYSVVNMKCTDRPKLLFDTVCTLTDMNYVVSHASISSEDPYVVQEYYIRHMDGYTLDTENERRRVMQCLEAAIERRVPQGLRLDICTKNRVGLLSDITRVFCENGLSVSNAEISTYGEKAVGTFYVTDASGNTVDQRTVQTVRHEIGATTLKVNKSPVWIPRTNRSSVEEKPRISSFGSLLRSQLERLSGNLSSIRS